MLMCASQKESAGEFDKQAAGIIIDDAVRLGTTQKEKKMKRRKRRDCGALWRSFCWADCRQL